jgi:hypothetical protein
LRDFGEYRLYVKEDEVNYQGSGGSQKNSMGKEPSRGGEKTQRDPGTSIRSQEAVIRGMEESRGRKSTTSKPGPRSFQNRQGESG